MKIQKIGTSQNKTVFRNQSNKKRNENKTITAAAIGGTVLLGSAIIAGVYFNRSKSVNSKQQTQEIKEYITELVHDLEIYTGEKILPENLSCIMNREEFLNVISNLKKENYIASKENIEKGIFKADLHSHSVFSDGKGTVENILNQVAEYSNKLNQKTGEKFIFALTDHDNAEGVKKALQIISQEPEKFKNTRFITGSEISYLLKSDKSSNPCETQELLVYGFNPFSKNVEEFFKNLKAKRNQLKIDYLNELSKEFPDTKFLDDEFTNIFLNKKNINPMMNSVWLIHHYAQIKTVLSATAKSKNLNPENYFLETMEKAPEKLNLYEFKKANLIEGWINENPKITEINKKYLSAIDKNGEIISRGENTTIDILNAFKDEKECIIGFAHPYYISERTNNPETVINDIKSKFGDKLKVTESYHQAYSKNLLDKNLSKIEKINSECENGNIIAIGGRDNHNSNWLDS